LTTASIASGGRRCRNSHRLARSSNRWL